MGATEMTKKEEKTSIIDWDTLKPSKLIRVSVADIKEAHAKPGVYINMNMWVSLTAEGVCEVCLAGAVLLKEIGEQKMRDLMPSYMHSLDPYDIDILLDDDVKSRKIRSLDDFRRGDVENGLRFFYYDQDIESLINSLPDEQYGLDEPDIEEGIEQFCCDMLKIADFLEDLGQ